MKQILTIIFCSILLNVAKSQTILPLQTDEYCPGVEYTFTATITKPYSSMIGEGTLPQDAGFVSIQNLM